MRCDATRCSAGFSELPRRGRKAVSYFPPRLQKDRRRGAAELNLALGDSRGETFFTSRARRRQVACHRGSRPSGKGEKKHKKNGLPGFLAAEQTPRHARECARLTRAPLLSSLCSHHRPSQISSSGAHILSSPPLRTSRAFFLKLHTYRYPERVPPDLLHAYSPDEPTDPGGIQLATLSD